MHIDNKYIRYHVNIKSYDVICTEGIGSKYCITIPLITANYYLILRIWDQTVIILYIHKVYHRIAPLVINNYPLLDEFEMMLESDCVCKIKL